MFLGNSKRSRTARLSTVRKRETGWTRLCANAKDRGTMLRVVLCLIGMFLLLFAVQSWRAPFPYRVGQVAPHGIAAKIDFDRVDVDATNALRREADAKAPLMFQHDPSALDALPQRLREALAEVAQSATIAELSPDVARAFGLVPLTGTVEAAAPSSIVAYTTGDPEGRFATLKETLGAPEMRSTQQHIDGLAAELGKFVEPLRRHGIIDPSASDDTREPISPERPIRIIGPDGNDNEWRLSQLQLASQLNDAGELNKSWLSYPLLNEIRPAVTHWLLVTAKPTLQFDDRASAAARVAARDAVEPQMRRFIRGDLLVQPGDVIDEDRLARLRDEYWAAELQVGSGERMERMAIVLLLISVLAVLNGFYIVHNEPRLVASLERLAVYLGAIIVAAVLARSLSFYPWPAELIPLIAIAMVLAVSYNQVLATLTAFTVCIVVTLSTTSQLSHFIAYMSTCAMAVVPLSRVASRSKIIVVGAYTAATYLCVRLCLGVIEAQSFTEAFHDWSLAEQSLKGAALCFATGFLVAGSLPFIESAFGVVTDISLLELSDPSHPLLRELVHRAPGTYNHSIAVGTIAETAAERIGANGLLVRVGAHFHDIGKMLKPSYFIENMQQGAENRHTHLAPAMSTLIIIGHVKDGVDLAERHNLPQAIIDFIEQHHGTTLVEYFYHEAAKLVENQPDHRTDAEESSFRYPGPKPQTREAGVLMLADAVESASRTLSDPTPKRIESLVHNITLKRLLDGQFDESSLRLNEIRAIEDSLTKSLIGVYHGRIRYPEAQTA